MASDDRERETPGSRRIWRRALLGAIGVVLGGLFLWLAMRHFKLTDIESALRQLEVAWLTTGVAAYIASDRLAMPALGHPPPCNRQCEMAARRGSVADWICSQLCIAWAGR
jgi:hypothetical protein